MSRGKELENSRTQEFKKIDPIDGQRAKKPATRRKDIVKQESRRLIVASLSS